MHDISRVKYDKKGQNPQCLRNLACVVFYREPAKYPRQINSQVSITLTGPQKLFDVLQTCVDLTQNHVLLIFQLS